MKGTERLLHLTLLTAVFAMLLGGAVTMANADRVEVNLHRIGSVDTVPGAARCPMYIVREGTYMLAKKELGMTHEQMLNPAFFPPGLPPQYVAMVTEMINLLYAWTGTDDEWRDAALELCQVMMQPGKGVDGSMHGS